MPTNREKNWLLCYDIANPKRLAKIHRHMKKTGIAMQYSVFQLKASNTGINLLIKQLSEMINVKEDDIRIYPLHNTPKKYILGQSLFPEDVMLFNNRNTVE